MYVDFQHYRNTLFLLQEEHDDRITYFICVHHWQVLFAEIQRKSKEVDLGATSEAFSCTQLKGALHGIACS